MIEWIVAQVSWETLAVFSALAYVIFAARESIWCWPCALVSTAIYILLFWDVSLLMESALNIYYLAMAVYGWWRWRNRGLVEDGNPAAQIHTWPLHYHAIAIVGIFVISAVSGVLLTKYTHASLPYLDSLTTWAAVFATWMVAQKVLENWLYWIIIDAISIYLYISKDLHQTAILFVLYVFIAAYGWWSWKAKLTAQKNLA